MNRREFEDLFRHKLNEAAEFAEAYLDREISRQFKILRGSPGSDGRRISIEDAVDELYISELLFFLIIDLAVVEFSSGFTWVWVRESGHQPDIFNRTWNQPAGSGPFKILIAEDIREMDSLD